MSERRARVRSQSSAAPASSAAAARAQGLDKDPDVQLTLKKVMVQKLVQKNFQDLEGAKDLPEEEGIFAEGGPLVLVLTAGTDVRLVTRGNFTLMARIRYDYQRFTTDQLQFSGFSRTQDVHRLGFGLGVDYSRP